MSTAELRELVASLAVAQRETDRQIKETDRQMKETDRQMKETDRKLKESKHETDLQMQQTDRRIKELSELFTGQWGKLVEALMRPGTARLFKERGVAVSQMTEARTGYDAEGREIEVDMTLVDSGTIVVVEIKTTCKVEDVNWHLDKLARFKQAFREYGDWEVQGAMAALKFEGASDRYAYRNGLWVLKCMDGITQLANDSKFQVRKF